MKLRIVPLAVVTAGAVVTLAACASSSNGTFDGGHTPSPNSSDTSSSTTSTSSGDAHTGAELAAREKAGIADITTAHLTLTTTISTQTITAAADEKLANGKVTGIDLKESLPTVGSLRIIITGGKTYAMPPTSENTGRKPWVLVRSGSSNVFAQQLAKTLSTTLSSSSTTQFLVLSQAISSLKVVGHPSVNGAPTTEYAATISVDKLPSSYPGRQVLNTAGISSLPINLWLDSAGRPVELTEKIMVQGQTSNTTVMFGEFNKPVTITAPPASEVDTN